MTDREKLIELLNTALGDADITRYELLLIADYLCDNGVTVQKWIPVTERLPDSQADVLVVAFWHERWQPMIGWHSERGKKWRVFTSHGARVPGGVTHWMPLPEPPREGVE